MLATLTSDVGRILSKMHLVQPKGNINFITGVRIAHVSPKQMEYFYDNTAQQLKLPRITLKRLSILIVVQCCLLSVEYLLGY